MGGAELAGPNRLDARKQRLGLLVSPRVAVADGRAMLNQQRGGVSRSELGFDLRENLFAELNRRRQTAGVLMRFREVAEKGQSVGVLRPIRGLETGPRLFIEADRFLVLPGVVIRQRQVGRRD